MISEQASNDEDKYGYGIWLTDDGQPYFEGCDPGVSFFSFYDCKAKLLIVVISNTADDVWEIAINIKEEVTSTMS